MDIKLYDETQLDDALISIRNKIDIANVVMSTCHSISLLARTEVAKALEQSFSDKPLHTTLYCAGLGREIDLLYPTLTNEHENRFRLTADKLMDIIIAESCVDKFEFTDIRELVTTEAKLFVYAFHLKIKESLQFAFDFDNAFDTVMKYFAVLAKARQDSSRKIDKWGDIDDSDWQKLLIDFAAEKLKLDDWLWFVLNPKVKTLSVGKHFYSENLDSVGVRFTRIIVNTALDDTEAFVDFNSDHFDVSSVVNFKKD